MNKLQTSRIHLHEYVIVVIQEVSDKGELVKTARVTIYLKHYDTRLERYLDKDLSNKFVASFASYKDAMKYLFTKI